MTSPSTRSEPVDSAQTRLGPGCSACGTIEFLYECLHCGHRFCADHHKTEEHLCRTIALEAVFKLSPSEAPG